MARRSPAPLQAARGPSGVTSRSRSCSASGDSTLTSNPSGLPTPGVAPILAAVTQSTPILSTGSSRGATKPTGRSHWTVSARWRRSCPRTSTGPRASQRSPRRLGAARCCRWWARGWTSPLTASGADSPRAHGSSRSVRPGRSVRETWRSTSPPAWRRAPARAQRSGVCRADSANGRDRSPDDRNQIPKRRG